MGVYLYSQLLSGKSHNQMELAEQCFGNTSHEMDAETRKVNKNKPISTFKVVPPLKYLELSRAIGQEQLCPKVIKNG